MKSDINPIILIVVGVVLLAGVVGGAVWYSSPHTPPGVHYTPGVPPWAEKGAGPYKPYADIPRTGDQAPPPPSNNPGAPR